MKVFRYPVRSLIGDYLRAGVGLAVGLGVLASAPGSVTVIVIFTGVTVLFAGFSYRTAQRHLLRVVVTDAEICSSGINTRELPWPALEQLVLRYYGARRHRERQSSGGFMQLTLKGAGASMTLESSIEGFEYIAWHAAKAARENGISLDPASAGNLLELGLDVDEDKPAPEIKAGPDF